MSPTPARAFNPHRDATSALTLASERGYDDIVAIIREEEQRRAAASSGEQRRPATRAPDPDGWPALHGLPPLRWNSTRIRHVAVRRRHGDLAAEVLLIELEGLTTIAAVVEIREQLHVQLVGSRRAIVIE
jgi:transposase